jgi:hypothetical protein
VENGIFRLIKIVYILPQPTYSWGVYKIPLCFTVKIILVWFEPGSLNCRWNDSMRIWKKYIFDNINKTI